MFGFDIKSLLLSLLPDGVTIESILDDLKKIANACSEASVKITNVENLLMQLQASGVLPTGATLTAPGSVTGSVPVANAEIVTGTPTMPVALSAAQLLAAAPALPVGTPIDMVGAAQANPAPIAMPTPVPDTSPEVEAALAVLKNTGKAWGV